MGAGIGLKVLPLLDLESLKGEALEAIWGPRLDFDYATTNAQIADAAYASSYGVKGKVKIGFSDEITDKLKYLGGVIEIAPPELNIEIPFANSPQGMLTTASGTVNLTESVELTVTLDENYTSFLTIPNIHSVELYKVKGLAPPQLVATLPASTGLDEVFTYVWSPTVDDVGDNTFFAMVRPELLDFLPPFEVTGNSGVNVYVRDMSEPPEIPGYWEYKRGPGLGTNCTGPGGTGGPTFVLWPNGGMTGGWSAGGGGCQNTAGTTYAPASGHWSVSGDTLTLAVCNGSIGNDPVNFTWNGSLMRWEGFEPNGGYPYPVCLMYWEMVNFTGQCIAGADCVTVDYLCDGVVTPGSLNCGQYCSPACDECATRPYPWEAGITPVCF
jgi:hypothetical protein